MAELGTTTVYGNLYVSNDAHAKVFHGQVTNPLLADIQEKFPQNKLESGYIVEMKNGIFQKQKNKYCKYLFVVSTKPAIKLQDDREGIFIQLGGSVPIKIRKKDQKKQKKGDKIVLYKNGIGKIKRWYDIGKTVIGQIFEIKNNKFNIIIY